jgi:hypothetical protein
MGQERGNGGRALPIAVDEPRIRQDRLSGGHLAGAFAANSQIPLAARLLW